jgi:hypothetical protein
MNYLTPTTTDSPEKLLALWHNINETIADLARMKSSLSPTKYKELVDRAYTQKRIVGALLRALKPVSKRDLRFQQRLGVNRYEEA